MARNYRFTLLAVAVIFLTLATAITWNLVSITREQAQLELQRLELVLELAATQTHLSRPLAWTWSADGYRFLHNDEFSGWHTFDGDKYLHPQRLPNGVKIMAVKLENRALAPGDPLPFADGRMRAFHIVLQVPEGTKCLEGTPDGRVVEGRPPT